MTRGARRAMRCKLRMRRLVAVGEADADVNIKETYLLAHISFEVRWRLT